MVVIWRVSIYNYWFLILIFPAVSDVEQNEKGWTVEKPCNVDNVGKYNPTLATFSGAALNDAYRHLSRKVFIPLLLYYVETGNNFDGTQFYLRTHHPEHYPRLAVPDKLAAVRKINLEKEASRVVTEREGNFTYSTQDLLLC